MSITAAAAVGLLIALTALLAGRRLRTTAGDYPPPQRLVEDVISEVLHRQLHPAGAAPTCAVCRSLAALVAPDAIASQLEQRAVDAAAASARGSRT